MDLASGAATELLDRAERCRNPPQSATNRARKQASRCGGGRRAEELGKSSALGSKGGAPLRRQCGPAKSLRHGGSDSVGFLIFDSRYRGYGIAEAQAKERSLIGFLPHAN
ncbi:hypothetical protein ZWY2020_055027 [Hordeum vulgare]|nr:hypothetical protein ZWY2020_055027 [Hordeum vulgare]